MTTMATVAQSQRGVRPGTANKEITTPISTAQFTSMTFCQIFITRCHDLLEKMGFDPCDIDELTVRSGLSAEAVSAALLELELDGKIAGLPGGLYQRIR